MEALAQNNLTSLADAIDIGLLNLTDATFYRTEGGFTGLNYAGKDYKRVSLRRALPLGDPMRYISVADSENKEIGIILDLAELKGEALEIVLAELNRRYYCPTVQEIKSVKDKLGYVYMEFVIEGPTGRAAKTCAVKDVNKNIRLLGDDRLIVFDVDGNRYMIESLKGLDKKSLKRLEPYLF